MSFLLLLLLLLLPFPAISRSRSRRSCCVVALLVILQRDLGTTSDPLRLGLRDDVRRGRADALPRRRRRRRRCRRRACLIFGEAYRRTRFVDAWLNPWADPQGDGYQLIQGLIALGSGGWFGVGLGASRAEVGLPAERAHRLHLRDHRRGARAARGVRSCWSRSGCCSTRASGSRCGARHVRAAARRRHHRLDRPAGGRQPGRRHGAAADHGRAAAARVVRRHGARRDARGDRRPRERRARERRAATRARVASARAAAPEGRTVKVVIAGGGTAGHVFPAARPGAIALATDHGAVGRVRRVPRTGRRRRSSPRPGIPFHAVRGGARCSARSRVATAKRAVRGGRLGRARAARWSRDADVVVGSAATRACRPSLAARRRARPLVLHEQNAVPGLVNRSLARWARAWSPSRSSDARRALPGRRRVERDRQPDPRADRGACRRAAPSSRAEACAAFELDAGSHDRRRVRREPGRAPPRPRRSPRRCRSSRIAPTFSCSCSTGPAHDATSCARSAGGADGAARARRSRSSTGWTSRYAVADLAVARAGAEHRRDDRVRRARRSWCRTRYATEDHQEANARELVARRRRRASCSTPTCRRRRLARRILDLVDDDATAGGDGAAAPRVGHGPTPTALATLVRGGGAR